MSPLIIILIPASASQFVWHFCAVSRSASIWVVFSAHMLPLWFWPTNDWRIGWACDVIPQAHVVPHKPRPSAYRYPWCSFILNALLMDSPFCFCFIKKCGRGHKAWEVPQRRTIWVFFILAMKSQASYLTSLSFSSLIFETWVITQLSCYYLTTRSRCLTNLCPQGPW